MNKEELIATLQACYFGDKGAYNKMLKEYEQLQSNWNELKKWLEEEIKSWEEAINEERDYELVNEFASRCNNFEEILNKMQELERGEE